MKKLILVGGTMGVGKSSVCRALHQRLTPSVWLDGDWCWNLNPFEVTEETKAMAMDNIAHLLGSFLRCSQTEYVIFSWVMHQQEIIDVVLEGRGQVANSVMNVNIPGYSEEITGYSQDLEKAKALMAEAGYADGFKTTLFASGDVRNREAQIIQAQLLEIGIEVDIQLYEWGAFLDACLLYTSPSPRDA